MITQIVPKHVLCEECACFLFLLRCQREELRAWGSPEEHMSEIASVLSLLELQECKTTLRAATLTFQIRTGLESASVSVDRVD